MENPTPSASRSCTTDDVEDILTAIDPNTSDYETSGDEYTPSDGEIKEMMEELDDEDTPRRPKKKKKRRQREESSDEDDIPLARLVDDDDIPLACLKNMQPQLILDNLNLPEDDEALAEILEMPVWTDLPFEEPDTAFRGTLELPPEDGNTLTPYQYFKMIITDEMLQNAEVQTNIYAMQTTGIQLKTTAKEIEVFIGLFLKMGLVQAHSVRAYWDARTRYPPVADRMTRERFASMSRNIHFVDNNSITEDDRTDKLWKVRPWIAGVQNSLIKIPPEEHHAVDEIMVPFKGQSAIKVFVRNKPHRWGFKMWGRCGSSGILYQFDVYQGSADKCKKSQCGASGDVVLRMVSGLEGGKNYKIFADNYFSSLQVVKALKERSMFFVGTVRSNRLKGCQLKSEKVLKKDGRGSSDSKVEMNSNAIAVRWFDNRSVDFISSYKGVEPVGEANRWDKKLKERVCIPCPAVVKEYNHFMGGVDLLDSLTALYKFPMKSRRWYIYIFLHTLSMAVVVGWLWYKTHCQLLGTKPIKLSFFQHEVSEGLVGARRPFGRPPSNSPPLPMTSVAACQRTPVKDIRLDGVDHLPGWTEDRQRCKLQGCSGFSYVCCQKCKVQLCFNRNRNCFSAFHTRK